jgi:hypothetical protein
VSFRGSCADIITETADMNKFGTVSFLHDQPVNVEKSERVGSGTVFNIQQGLVRLHSSLHLIGTDGGNDKMVLGNNLYGCLEGITNVLSSVIDKLNVLYPGNFVSDYDDILSIQSTYITGEDACPFISQKHKISD